MELIGKHYKFSARLLAIIKTVPPGEEKKDREESRPNGTRVPPYQKDDLEVAATSIDSRRDETAPRPRKPTFNVSHYAIARQMVHYQTVDSSAKCRCWV